MLGTLTRSSPRPAFLSLARMQNYRTPIPSIFYIQQMSSLSKNIGARSTSRQFSKSMMDKATKDTASSTKKSAAEQSSTSSSFAKFCYWYLGEKTMPPRWTLPWYREMILICSVFAITGSSTMVLVRFVARTVTHPEYSMYDFSVHFSSLIALLTGTPGRIKRLGFEGKP
jgi:hypothetical protein